MLFAVDVIAGNGHDGLDAAPLAAGFQQIERGQHVGFIGAHGIVVRRADARLPGQVNDRRPA